MLDMVILGVFFNDTMDEGRVFSSGFNIWMFCRVISVLILSIYRVSRLFSYIVFEVIRLLSGDKFIISID